MFWNRISNALASAKIEFVKPTRLVKSELFERYLREYLFSKDRYNLLHKSSKTFSADFIWSPFVPDFVFEDKPTGFRFSIEAKHRMHEANAYSIEICTSNQLRRYKEFARTHDLPTFIALGLNGEAVRPSKIYLIPIAILESNIVPFLDIHNKYEIPRMNKCSIATIKSLSEFGARSELAASTF